MFDARNLLCGFPNPHLVNRLSRWNSIACYLLCHFHQNLLQSYSNVMSLNTINSDSGTDLRLPYPVKKHITVTIFRPFEKKSCTNCSLQAAFAVRQVANINIFLLAYLLQNYTICTRLTSRAILSSVIYHLPLSCFFLSSSSFLFFLFWLPEA